MEIIQQPLTLQNTLKNINNKTIGFVPTMGALHEGHLSLIKQSKKENEITVVSIFVNPTQFLAGEDLDKYPSKYDSDKKICELAGVDYIFFPTIDAIYTKDEVLVKAPKSQGFILEGFQRPGHFDGMLQIVLKLLNIVNPTNAYFGKKDAQQLSLIKQMVRNFYLDMNIIECDIVREADGLAMSSRNVYLSKEERTESLLISKSLKYAAKLVGTGKTDVKEIEKEIEKVLTSSERIEIDYIQIVNREFQSIETVELKNSIILVAVKIGTTRLIDNIWI